MTASPARSPIRRQAREKEILEAAARVFRSKGYHAARIQDVAEAVGMQKGSLYYYISTKEDLLRGLVEGPLQAMNDTTRAILATGHRPAQKLERVIENHLRLLQEHRDTIGIFLREDLSLLDEASDRDLRALAREYEDLLEALLREGVAQGVFAAALDPRITVKALVGMCNGTYAWFRPGGRYTLPEIARRLSDLVLHGLQAPRPHA